MLLSYIFDDFTTQMHVSPDVISFGSNRVAVKNLASVSAPRNLKIWKALDAGAIPINVIAIVTFIAISDKVAKTGNNISALMTFAILIAIHFSIIMFIFYFFNIRATRNLVLVTSGGNLTVFKNIRRSFAREITALLHNVMAGKETRKFTIDRRKRTISVIEA